MTRKDYDALAFDLRTVARDVDGIADDDTRQATFAGLCAAVEAIASTLKADNPRFDRERFFTACELD